MTATMESGPVTATAEPTLTACSPAAERAIHIALLTAEAGESIEVMLAPLMRVSGSSRSVLDDAIAHCAYVLDPTGDELLRGRAVQLLKLARTLPLFH
jgi:hypothetical protein